MARVEQEGDGVRGRTDAGPVDGGQDALISFYGSPQDKQ